jgi:hypothetical protein
LIATELPPPPASGAPVETGAPVPVAEAARRLGLAHKTVAGWYDGTDRCPVKRYGRNYYVIKAWLDRQTTCDLAWIPLGWTRAAAPAGTAAIAS